MDSKDLSKYTKLDEKLKKLNKNIKWLIYITPINILEEKEKFFQSNFNENPKFIYPEPEHDISSIKDKLSKIEVPKGEFQDLFERRIEYMKGLCDIVLKRGTDEFLETSIKVFGIPKAATIEDAKSILKKVIDKEDPEEELTINYRKAKKIIEKTLTKLNLVGWKVKLREQYTSSIKSPEKTVYLSRNREFSEYGLRKLILHEIGVHVLRAQNGNEQIFPFIFGENDLNSLLLEEGLAIYIQKMNDLMPYRSWRSICANVIAIDMLIKKKSFKEIFNHLLTLGFNEEFSWAKCVRIFRGGGLTKDYMYLEGYNLVKAYKGDVEDIFIARVPIEKIEWTKENLNSPKYLPITEELNL